MTIATTPLTTAAPISACLAQPETYDLLIIGGGATGLGTAADAAARGFKVAPVESHDFAEGTSSRATKLVHGGVRYLAQGNVSLVREAAARAQYPAEQRAAPGAAAAVRDAVLPPAGYAFLRRGPEDVRRAGRQGWPGPY